MSDVLIRKGKWAADTHGGRTPGDGWSSVGTSCGSTRSYGTACSRPSPRPRGLRSCQHSIGAFWPPEPQDTSSAVQAARVCGPNAPPKASPTFCLPPAKLVCLLACHGCFPARSSVGDISKTQVGSPGPWTARGTIALTSGIPQHTGIRRAQRFWLSLCEM